jgi:hypothetical protein
MPKQPMTDQEFMANPKEWPAWPLLPVKRSTQEGRTECGFLLPTQTDVYLDNIYALTRDWRPEGAKHIAYDSFAAIIADGWRVD